MASIFTYDPDPPRVSSPWLQSDEPESLSTRKTSSSRSSEPGLLSDYGVTKLQAEPQEGPTEYKLHLLLRPRRAFKSMSTAGQTAAYQYRTPSASQSASSASTPVPSVSPRQSRLHHLTTQLLWRLQQSSPFHASSSKDLVMPRLQEDQVSVDHEVKASALVPGLEESKGALYEIGVADDGALIGLTKDEMDESIQTLRIMAASLGCSVEVLRMVIVGECEWYEETEFVNRAIPAQIQIPKSGKLWVAEALVVPNLGLHTDQELRRNGQGSTSENSSADRKPSPVTIASQGCSKTPQLRVTLTGPTTSGKSSLLGTLSTGTLDNGRGKSRLSLLKHRHEVVSGVTSSIAQEIIGYKDQSIMNFSKVNIESWTDIHDRSDGGRLVFVLDSGGHPRYRRTVLRGLMNWAPHWSILCIAADGADAASSGGENKRTSETFTCDVTPSIDLVSAHLTLALKLNVPMAVVITKLDLASKAGLQKTVGKVLTSIKEAKRLPKILQPDQKQHDQLQQIPAEDSEKVRALVKSICDGKKLTDIVPIILTSSVKGTGIGTLHALLQSLPLPPAPTASDFVGNALNPEQPRSLFHIDDTFSLPSSYANLAGDSHKYLDDGVVVSGYLRFGEMSVGDRIVLGPFPADADDEDLREAAPSDRPSPSSDGLSISHPSSAELARVAMKNAVSASAVAGQWHSALIVSARNLRLPVRTLAAGQAGSIGLVFEAPEADSTAPSPRIRRGMVLAIPSKHMSETGLNLQAASGFTATFSDSSAESLIQGSFVNVYVASVRATARIVTISRVSRAVENSSDGDETEGIFHINDMDGSPDSAAGADGSGREIYLELQNSREWVELGSKVIILEGGSQDRSGLEGVVGTVTEIAD